MWNLSPDAPFSSVVHFLLKVEKVRLGLKCGIYHRMHQKKLFFCLWNVEFNTGCTNNRHWPLFLVSPSCFWKSMVIQWDPACQWCYRSAISPWPMSEFWSPRALLSEAVRVPFMFISDLLVWFPPEKPTFSIWANPTVSYWAPRQNWLPCIRLPYENFDDKNGFEGQFFEASALRFAEQSRTFSQVPTLRSISRFFSSLALFSGPIIEFSAFIFHSWFLHQFLEELLGHNEYLRGRLTIMEEQNQRNTGKFHNLENWNESRWAISPFPRDNFS